MAVAGYLFGSLLLAGLVTRPVSALLIDTSTNTVALELSTPPNLSASCAATFNKLVDCDPILRDMGRNYMPTPDEVVRVCHTACKASLEALRTTQLANCHAHSDNVTSVYRIYPATYEVDRMLHAYNWACLRDSADDLCYPQVAQDTWKKRKSMFSFYELSFDVPCSDCHLRTLQAALDSPVNYDDSLASKYATLTSSCQATSYPVASHTTYDMGLLIVPWPSRLPTTCESTYTIQKSDTCQSISKEHQVSTFTLLNANNLPAYCEDFPAEGTDICIPQKCDTYTVKSGDNSSSASEATGLTKFQFLDFNPELFLRPKDAPSMLGYTLCISPPGIRHITKTVTAAPTKTPVLDRPVPQPGHAQQLLRDDASHRR